MKHYDVIIIGAGMVGLALALGLAKQNFTVLVLDAQTIKQNEGRGDYDLRVSAITQASANLFKSLDIWPAILAARVGRFEQMYVYDKQGAINFDAARADQTELGWIIENSVIQTALYQALAQYPQVEVLLTQQVTKVTCNEKNAIVDLQNTPYADAELLVAADGANSWVREFLQHEITTWSYEQSALVANVTCSKGHQNTAWQRFLTTGPLAFLPLDRDDLCSIVWSADTEYANTLMTLTPADLSKALTQLMGDFLGDITVSSKCVSFPLTMRHIKSYIAPGVAFVGDAAHTIHPLAGQGANLGFADVVVLLEVLMQARTKKRSLGNYAMLRRFERNRKAHVSNMIILMESFKRLFGNDNRCVSSLRNHGLNMMDKIPLLKHYIMQQAMGLTR